MSGSVISMGEAGTGSIQLWIDPAYPHETTSSLLDRAASFYRLHRDVLVKKVFPGIAWYGHERDWDFISGRHEEQLASALRRSEPESLGVKMRKSEMLLSPLARRGYCPVCFLQDLREGRTPYFRWQWAIAFSVNCHEHKTPLFTWRRMRTRQRVLPWSWTMRPSEALAAEVPWMMEDLIMVDLSKELQVEPGSPLQLVADLESSMVDIAARSHEKWERVPMSRHLSVRDALAGATVVIRAVSSEPRASLCRPGGLNAPLFGGVPRHDWKRKAENAYRGFVRQASVEWRRSIMFDMARSHRSHPRAETTGSVAQLFEDDQSRTE